MIVIIKIKSVAQGVKAKMEMSPVVQWLRHRTRTRGDTGSILVRELRSHKLHSVPPAPTKKKTNKQKTKINQQSNQSNSNKKHNTLLPKKTYE